METQNRSRLALFCALATLLSLVAVGLGTELLTRLLIPREVFWPISNIYRAADISAVAYTYMPSFTGTAFGVDLETNSLGFRGPEWRREKSRGTLRVALIGDSIAFGFGVPFDQTAGELLAAALHRLGGPPVEVLNFGINGHNSRQQLAVLQHYGLRFDPDLVILVPANNDHKPALLVDPEGWLHWDGSAKENTRVVDKSIAKISSPEPPGWIKHSRALLYLRLWLRQRAATAGPRSDQLMPATDQSADWMAPTPPGPVSTRLANTVFDPLRESIEMAQGRGIAVVLAPFCSSRDYRQMFQILATERGVPVLELPTLFPEAKSWAEFTAKFSLGWDSHPNAEAQQRFAEGLAERIASLHLDLEQSAE